MGDFVRLTAEESELVVSKAYDLSREINVWMERNMRGCEDYSLTTLTLAIEMSIGASFGFSGRKYDQLSKAVQQMLPRCHKDIKKMYKDELENAKRKADA